MCLMLYLGTERPVVVAPAQGPLVLERLRPKDAPTALRDQASIYAIGARTPRGVLSADRDANGGAGPAPGEPALGDRHDPKGDAGAAPVRGEGAGDGAGDPDAGPSLAWTFGLEHLDPNAASDAGCGCIFRDTDTIESIAAYHALRSLLSGVLGGPRDAAALFGCWSGEEQRAPAVEMAVSVAELSADIELFSDVIHGWPILLRVTAPTAVRRAVAAGDR
ncbi:MAG: hypothetical protein AAF909_04050 [Pseudomonadota bacterium]